MQAMMSTQTTKIINAVMNVALTLGVPLFGYAAFMIVTSIPEWGRNEGLWPTTVYVETEIGASWLPDEERACLSWTDSTSKQIVDVLDCSTTSIKTSAYHNIPVEFTATRKATGQKVAAGDPRLWQCRKVSGFLGDYHFACKANVDKGKE